MFGRGQLINCMQVSSTSPVTALISVKSPVTSFAVVQLNGTVDWMVAQRRALLAWTGHNLLIRPTVNTNLVGDIVLCQCRSVLTLLRRVLRTGEAPK